MLFWKNKLVRISSIFIIIVSCSNDIKKTTTFLACDSIAVNDFKNGVDLIVAENDWQEIENFRDSALAQKKIGNEQKKYFNAKLNTDSCSSKIIFRLKGDHTDHLWGKKWSFRLKTKNNILNGVNKISIQSPHTRNYMLEWYFHQLMKREGIIALDYFFFPLSINGNINKGIYAFEGHFTDELLLKNNRPIGPILKFSEENVFNKEFLKNAKNRDYQLLLNADMEICNLDSSEEFLLLVNEATHKLKLLINNKINPSEVLDIGKWGIYIGCMDIFSSAHHLRWHNLRYYYNPDSKKFEPIAFDLSSSMKNYQFLYTKRYKDELTKILLNDSLINHNTLFYMNKLTQDKYLESFFDEVQNLSNLEYQILKIDYRDYEDPKNKILSYRDSLKLDLSKNL